MSTANDRQVAGAHYSRREYQHWDFVCDTGLHYLPGCASKYVARWRDKNGMEDLEKSLHYLEKAEERAIPSSLFAGYALTERQARERALNDFVLQLPDLEAQAIVHMCYGEYEKAQTDVRALIAMEKSKA